DAMADAASIEVFGVQPFADLTGELSGVAARSRTLAGDLEGTAAALDANVEDSRATAVDLRALVVELDRMRLQLAAADPARGPDGAMDTASVIALARIVLLGL